VLQHFAVERGDAMFVPFYSTVFLAFESGNVIGLRMEVMSGGRGSRDEAHLMVMEKLDAMFEAGATLMAGGTASSVVDRYRQHVAANAKRLSH
jgi:2-iminoacetate synthase ThiH